ncbi:DUF2970 domain-containing protein [Paraglaciecola sp.]|uniref:DUF2970 domain-containing protein n=1 Tax=Paraglaciecola sp. TaxID=1920173 RepID=UPI0030F42CB1
MTFFSQQDTRYWQVLMSVAASMFGVQSQLNRQRDFKQTSFIPFLCVGIVFVLGLVLLLVAIVSFVV